MNRCRSFFRMGAVAALLSALSLSAQAQSGTRDFPAKALRGTLVVVQPPNVTMDDRATRLSPGARIYNTNNSLVMSSSLLNKEVVVNYTVDLRDQIQNVWILTEAEAREKRAGFGVQRNFVFESMQTRPAGTSN
ncbi:MAG: hypothetical protein QUV35_09385 [Hydrogenophaga sp.]|uniref:hypothetical protein n=1 Tax=Hydrogenophaga sp. TaxID=1904254 RepID=UPI00261617AF|nr:hypothetical protein [Hydrogenophaga sp.]MDM7942831.1 hypothetical protein [Hydrogenophaga sp.]